MSRKYHFKLFVCGMTKVSESAVSNLRRLITEEQIDCEFTIIDVLDRPDLAEKHAVVATPTLVKESPAPRQVLVGDLSDLDTVKTALHIALHGSKGKPGEHEQ